MYEVTLPRLVGSRQSAAVILDRASHAIAADRVVLNCRELLSGSPSFADEVVKQVLIDGQAAELVVLAAGDDFARYILESASLHGVQDRVAIRPAGSEIDA